MNTALPVASAAISERDDQHPARAAADGPEHAIGLAAAPASSATVSPVEAAIGKLAAYEPSAAMYAATGSPRDSASEFKIASGPSPGTNEP